MPTPDCQHHRHAPRWVWAAAIFAIMPPRRLSRLTTENRKGDARHTRQQPRPNYPIIYALLTRKRVYSTGVLFSTFLARSLSRYLSRFLSSAVRHKNENSCRPSFVNRPIHDKTSSAGPRLVLAEVVRPKNTHTWNKKKATSSVASTIGAPSHNT